MPGDPVEDCANHKIGIVVSFNHTSEMLTLEDSEGNQWKAPLYETEPYSVADW